MMVEATSMYNLPNEKKQKKKQQDILGFNGMGREEKKEKEGKRVKAS